jgi:hypothetical protein
MNLPSNYEKVHSGGYEKVATFISTVMWFEKNKPELAARRIVVKMAMHLNGVTEVFLRRQPGSDFDKNEIQVV